jgi:hypothetical protein
MEIISYQYDNRSFGKVYKREDLKYYLENSKYSRILIVSGDSWTNQLKETVGIDRSWVKKYAIEKNYDLVIVSAWGGSSSTQSFINLTNLLSGISVSSDVFFGGDDSWFDSYRFNNKKLDVIVQWTSIIRDYSEITSWHKPYKFASLPDLTTSDFKKSMFDDYTLNIFNEKYFSYKVQLYSWQLQKYFEKWNIPYYFWMGFCDLVPESVENTDMDIRKYLNKDRWFNLYDKPNNMSDYLYYLEKKELPKRLNPLLTDGGNSGLIATISNTLKKLFKENENKTSLESTLFLEDLHPSEKGSSEIANILLKRF